MGLLNAPASVFFRNVRYIVRLAALNRHEHVIRRALRSKTLQKKNDLVQETCVASGSSPALLINSSRVQTCHVQTRHHRWCQSGA